MDKREEIQSIIEELEAEGPSPPDGLRPIANMMGSYYNALLGAGLPEWLAANLLMQLHGMLWDRNLNVP